MMVLVQWWALAARPRLLAAGSCNWVQVLQWPWRHFATGVRRRGGCAPECGVPRLDTSAECSDSGRVLGPEVMYEACTDTSSSWMRSLESLALGGWRLGGWALGAGARLGGALLALG